MALLGIGGRTRHFIKRLRIVDGHIVRQGPHGGGIMSEPLCVHIWIIASPAGPTSPGACKLCGERRDFPNAMREEDWAGYASGWGKARARQKEARGAGAVA